MAGQHPLFMGDAGLWNGILIVKMPKPIRFYAGDTVKYCASYTSETESSVVVPAAFGTTYAVDRAILLGGQAIAEAFAKHNGSGVPFFWSEKQLDHDDKLEMLVGTIRGVESRGTGPAAGSGRPAGRPALGQHHMHPAPASPPGALLLHHAVPHDGE